MQSYERPPSTTSVEKCGDGAVRYRLDGAGEPQPGRRDEDLVEQANEVRIQYPIGAFRRVTGDRHLQMPSLCPLENIHTLLATGVTPKSTRNPREQPLALGLYSGLARSLGTRLVAVARCGDWQSRMVVKVSRPRPVLPPWRGGRLTTSKSTTVPQTILLPFASV